MHIVNNDIKIIKNSKIDFINGYLEALTDIDGEQREFFATSKMLHSSNNSSCISELKELFQFIVEPKIIKTKEYNNDYVLTSLLQKLLLIKPFNAKKVSLDTLEEYRNYVVFHLTDFFDFAFEEEGIKLEDTKKINVLCVNDNSESFIVLKIINKNTKLFVLFFREKYSEAEIENWFDKIIIYCEKERKSSQM